MTIIFEIADPKAKPLSVKDVPAGVCFELTDPSTGEV